MNPGSQSKPLYDNLDTTFVNLWSLLRNLSDKGFIGRVRVELKDYSADIFLNGSSTPLVHEIDRAAGTEALEEAALHRVVLRARETPGKISVFEGATEAVPKTTVATSPRVTPQSATSEISAAPIARPVTEAVAISADLQSKPVETAPATTEVIRATGEIASARELSEEIYPTGSYQDWPAILATSGELIGAVERGIKAAGEDFDSLFRAVRLELADDYSFLDPLSKSFEYAKGAASLKHHPPVSAFVSGLSEALRRMVDRVATGERARRLRERIALEMLSVARKRSEVLERSGFQPQLDRIAGTRVM